MEMESQEIQLEKCLQDLRIMEKREEALAWLTEHRNDIKDFGLILWQSTGCVAVLIYEIINVYLPVLSNTMTAVQSRRACQVAALYQAIAAHPNTNTLLLQSESLTYLIPLLKSESKSKPIELLRIAILSVIGVALKEACDSTIMFVLRTDLMPIILRIIATGSEDCRVGSAYIIYHVLTIETGLEFVCSQSDRFQHLVYVLSDVVKQLVSNPCSRILQPIARCFNRLADDFRARVRLLGYLPEELRDSTFNEYYLQDGSTLNCIIELINKIGISKTPSIMN